MSDVKEKASSKIFEDSMVTVKDAKSALKFLAANGVTYLDLRFSDLNGLWQHVSMHISMIDEDSLEEGFMFDGSSIAGWKAINESDMILMPDLPTMRLDAFAAQPTAIVLCDIYEPATGSPYDRDLDRTPANYTPLSPLSFLARAVDVYPDRLQPGTACFS